MGLELKDLDAATARRLRTQGQLQYFEAAQFAQVLEQEVARATSAGLSHIRAEMNLEDAARLASFLRRAVLLGA